MSDNKKDAVVATLLQLINKEIYKTGERLPPERELAKQLGVGRSIVREAVIALESIGRVEKRERLGVFVKPRVAEEVKLNLEYMQIPPVEFVPMQMEVRMFICVPAAELAAIRRTDEDLAKLWNAYREFENCPYVTPEEEVASSKWETLLHHLETESAHNPMLTRINESMSGLVERNTVFTHHYALNKDAAWFEHIKNQHRTIIQAIEDHDPETAGETLKQHLIDSYDAVIKNYPNNYLANINIYWEAIGRKSGK